MTTYGCMVNDIFKKIGDTSTLSQKIEQKIEDAIRTKKLNPGEKLPTEKDLCEMFGVSRTALREALKRLSARGLLSIRKGSGMYISEFTSETALSSLNLYFDMNFDAAMIMNIIRVRQMFEPEIAKHAARERTQEDINFLKANVEEMGQLTPQQKKMRGIVDINFHKRICEATKNPVLFTIMEPIYKLMPRIRAQIFPETGRMSKNTLNMHYDILIAITEGNEQAAYEAMNTHLMTALEDYIILISGEINGEQTHAK